MTKIIKLIYSQFHYFFNFFRYRELRRFLNKEKFSVLDLGCGDGIFMQIVNKHGALAIGVDKKRSNKSIIKAKIENLSINEKFNVVTFYHVIEHLDQPLKGLTVARRYLKSGGIVVIETPLIGNLTEKLLGKDYFAYYDQTHKSLMTKKQLFELINKAGLKVTHQGATWHEFPITLITTSFRQNFLKGILSIFLFFPIKIINWLKNEPNIIRLYCKSTNGSTSTTSFPQIGS